MTRRDIVLALLASARGQAFTPAQLQKAAFLVSENVPELIGEGPAFNFVPYDYGPFDRSVYDEASALQREGLGDIRPSPWGRWSVYAATAEGIEDGTQLLNQMDERYRKYVCDTAEWVRSQSFGGLVKSIYQAYPAMRANSIFKD